MVEVSDKDLEFNFDIFVLFLLFVFGYKIIFKVIYLNIYIGFKIF